ncbi:hypothetical protein Tchl_1231 [Thauera chlorobenzoica]|uniref:Uncharacterized protein n=1 Tax=Thauera chlorobenzoica TaxID=96773 RepID=A0A1L6FBN8_9RHOO|nr:hypothetical protein Tchl_1231 [Thauera chlorobenzoica]
MKCLGADFFWHESTLFGAITQYHAILFGAQRRIAPQRCGEMRLAMPEAGSAQKAPSSA